MLEIKAHIWHLHCIKYKTIRECIVKYDRFLTKVLICKAHKVE